MKKFFILIIGILSFFCLPVLAFGGLEAESDIIKGQSKGTFGFSEKEPITINGDLVEYFQTKGEVVASKNVEILFRDMVLTADKVRLNINSKEAVAEGNVKLVQDENVFFGDMVSYNFETRKGTILGGGVKAPPWYGSAEKMDKVSENQYNLERSYVTTCNLENPHYRLQAKKVKIFIGDRVEANHILMFIGKYPVLYLPYYKHSLKDNQFHVSITPGRNKEWGYFVLTRWRYYFNDNSRGNIFLDYRQNKGLAEGADYNYNAGKFGSGYLRVYYTKEDDREKSADRINDRSLIQYRHRADIGRDTVAIGEYHRLSDADFLKDYFFREQYERDDRPPSYISVIRTRPGYVASIYAQKRINDFFTEVERLPEVKLDIKNIQLLKTDFYYKGDITAAYLIKKFDKALIKDDLEVFRIDTSDRLSYVKRFFKFLNVTPFVGTRQTFYSANAFGDTNLIRGIFEGGVDVNTRFSRIFDVKTNFLNLDINRLRHIINPSIGYHYIHPPTIGPENLKPIDEVDEITRKNTLTLSLENKLQTKRFKTTKTGIGLNAKAETTSETVDLVRAIISTEYLFKPKNDSGSRFGDFTALLELRPYDWLFIKLDADYSHTILKDTKKISAFKTVNLDISADYGEKWNFGLQHRYERKESSRLSALVNYKLTPKWKIRALETYDFKTAQFYNREITLTRDLHCWEADFTVNIKNKTEMTFYVTFRLKAFPETPLELKTTYSRSRPGSQETLPQRWMKQIQ